MPSKQLIDIEIQNEQFNQEVKNDFDNHIISEYVIDLGFIEIGTEIDYNFKISNNGETDLSLAINQEHFDRLLNLGFRICFQKINLKIGETYEAILMFSPVNYTCDTAENSPFLTDFPIEISTGVCVNIIIKGMIAVPSLIASNSCLKFGTVHCGECKMKSLILRNCGRVPCKWSYQFVNDHGSFQLLSSEKTRRLIKCDREIEIRIVFEPKQNEEIDCNLVISCNNNPKQLVIKLSGCAISAVLKFDPVLDFEPVMHKSDSIFREFQITNTGNLMGEFYFLHFLKYKN